MAAPDQIAGLLGQTMLFAGMSPDERHELSATVQDRRYSKGEALFAQGDAANGMFVVMHGLVKIFQLTPDGHEVVLHLIQPNQTIAEAAVFQRSAYPAHAVAMAETRALYLPAETLIRFITGRPELTLRMLASLSNRLREFTRMLNEQQRGTSVARLAAWLLHRALPTGNMNVVKLEISRETLGSLLGLTRETLSRALSRLHEMGAIEVHRREIRLLDTSMLTKVAEGGKG